MKRWLILLLCLVPSIAFPAEQPAAPTGWTAPQLALPPALPTPVAAPTPVRAGSELNMASAASSSFNQALNQAATEAYRNGEIGRFDLARVRLAIILRPRVIAECQATVLDEGIQRGVVPVSARDNVSAFDWTQLLAFIKEMLPLILQIISIFSSNAAALATPPWVLAAAPYAPLLLAA